MLLRHCFAGVDPTAAYLLDQYSGLLLAVSNLFAQ